MEPENHSGPDKQIAEYVLSRILKGDVFFLGDENIVEIQEQESSIRFERTGIKAHLTKYDTESELFFLKKDEKLKKYSSDIWVQAGANWETLFGFFFENDLPIKVHVYFIGREFDLDKLSDMVYSLFTNCDDCIKVSKVKVLYEK